MVFQPVQRQIPGDAPHIEPQVLRLIGRDARPDLHPHIRHHLLHVGGVGQQSPGDGGAVAAVLRLLNSQNLRDFGLAFVKVLTNVA